MNDATRSLIEQWITVAGRNSEKTRSLYRHGIGKLFLAVDKSPDALTASDLVTFLQSLEDAKLSPATRAAYISSARSFFKFLENEGVIAKSPLNILRRPRVAPTNLNDFLTADEARAMMRAAKPRERLPLALALTTGLRVGELLAVEWRHLYVDPQGQRGLMVTWGKGGGTRVLPVFDPLWSLIVQDRQRQGLSTDFSTRDTSPLIAGVRTQQGMFAMVRRIAVRAGIGKTPGVHTLRATFATLSAASGADPMALMADLGHHRLETVMLYVRGARGLSDSSAGLVSALLFDQQPKRRRKRAA